MHIVLFWRFISIFIIDFSFLLVCKTIVSLSYLFRVLDIFFQLENLTFLKISSAPGARFLSGWNLRASLLKFIRLKKMILISLKKVNLLILFFNFFFSGCLCNPKYLIKILLNFHAFYIINLKILILLFYLLMLRKY